MPKAAVLQSSFSSGVVSPLYFGQADNPRYKKGLQSGLNALPLLQGPIVRRPGTKFCAQSKLSTPPILIPFQFSETQAYMLEFGNQYVRFYANNGQLVTVGSSYKVVGNPTYGPQYLDQFARPIGLFYASRATLSLQQGEFNFITTASIANGTILEIQTPYLQADLADIRYAQNADTLYLFHPKYVPYKLQRQTQTAWKLSECTFQDGPYFPLQTYQNIGDSTNVVVDQFTLAGGNYVNIVPATISGAVTDPGGSGQIQITTSAAHGYQTGQSIFISGIVGTTEANNWDSVTLPAAPVVSWQIIVTSTTTFLLVASTFTNAYVSGGNSRIALFATSALAQKLTGVLIPDAGRIMGFVVGTVRFYGYLASFENAAKALINFPLGGLNGVVLNTVATTWQLGVYSPGFGFPRCGTFHQDRLVLGGAGGAPQEVDGSEVGNYENFAPSDPATLNVTDKNAFSFQLNSTDLNSIQWMSSTAQGLLAATYVSEWVMTPSSTSDALTPTNFNAQQTSFFGSSSINPVKIGNGTLYVQRAGRKIREMSFFFAAGTFRSIDLTELSEQIAIPSVTVLAVTKETHPIIWAVRSDGALISMIYNRDDLSLIAGWMPHHLGGRSDASGTIPAALSIASIPAPDLTFDQLWIVVKRYINGSTVNCIEYMTKIFDDSVSQDDAFQLDCGGTFYSPYTITNITAAVPAVVNISVPVPFSNGDHITINDVVGVSKTLTDSNGNQTTTSVVNGNQFIIQGISGNTFQLFDFEGNPISTLPVDPSDGGIVSPYVSGGQAAKLVTTISGIAWLENETISALLDGGICGNLVVSNSGSVTLPFPAAKVQLGYGFKSQIQLLRPDAGSPDGTSIGKTRRTTRLAAQLYRTGDLSLGTSFNNLIPVQFSQADVDQADKAMPLFSGMIREGLESAYDFDSQPCIEMNSALPGCIQSLTSFMEEFDV